MSLREFWISVRTGARLLAPTSTVDSPKLDPSAIEGVLRRATIWLTPGVVAGFNEADFSFLPEDEQMKLKNLVHDFRRIAAQVPPTAPASDDQVKQALPLFRDIIVMMGFDRYGDAEAYRIGKQIERDIENRRPPELVELRFNTGTDNTGDPALWIWAFLAEEKEDEFLRRARELRPLLAGASRTVAPDLFPYISFRSVAEQAELAEAEAQ
jgi:hypothetical protein